jgi:hypothetical protein
MLLADVAAWCLALAVAIGSVLAVRRGRWDLAIAGLTLTSACSLLTANIGTIGIRLEQPAVIGLAGYLVLREWRALMLVVRIAAIPAVAFLVYLLANTISSSVVAPDPMNSLRLVAWTALSMLALVVAAVLVVRGSGLAGPHPTGEPMTYTATEPIDLGYGRWLVIAGIVHTAVAIAQVVAEAVLGSSWGVLRGDASIGKTFGLAWEPNLLAIQLASMTMFLIEPTAAQRLGPRVRTIATVALPVGIGLALSRGGLVALAAGIGLVLLRTWWPGRPEISSAMAQRAVVTAVIVVAISLAGFATLSLLNRAGVGLRPGDVITAERPQGTLLIKDPEATTPGGSQVTGSGDPAPTERPSPTIEPNYVGTGDTIALRLRNLSAAMAGLVESPLVGHGPGSFGRHYLEPTCACPAHIPNQIGATVYESGLVGLAALLVALAWVAVRGWRAGATAHVAALVVLLVGYQFTDAIRFGSNWILLGVIIGLVVCSRFASTARQPTAIR